MEFISPLIYIYSLIFFLIAQDSRQNYTGNYYYVFFHVFLSCTPAYLVVLMRVMRARPLNLFQNVFSFITFPQLTTSRCKKTNLSSGLLTPPPPLQKKKTFFNSQTRWMIREEAFIKLRQLKWITVAAREEDFCASHLPIITSPPRPHLRSLTTASLPPTSCRLMGA